LDDVSVLHCFKVWTSADDPHLAGLCRGLLYRRLYKTLDLSHLDDAAARAAVAAARAAVESAGGDGGYDLFYDEPADTAYEVYSACSEGPAAGEILVRRQDGRLMPFTSLSPLPQALSRQLMFRRLHVAA